MSSPNASTPPHHPTHGVNLSSEVIGAIVSIAFPEGRQLEIEQLPSGKSFNNRIYLVNIRAKRDPNPDWVTSNTNASLNSFPLALKVSGQFFGPDKVQNEVSCLFLLEKYCPNIPAPRVVAWSEDGVTARSLHRDSNFENSDGFSILTTRCPKTSSGARRGWILMSRRPGRVLSQEDLLGPHGKNIMRDLARFAAQWRQILPEADRIGNFKTVLKPDSVTPNDIYEDQGGNFAKLTIDGLLLCHYVPPCPIRTPTDYYRIKLEDQLQKLETEDVFAAQRGEISPLVREFLQNTLPKLSLFSPESPVDIKFTHYDLSPRNILVSETSPPAITGILDFEFAGFFPSEEEFTNNAVANSMDWPKDAYHAFLDELERLGVKTPLRGISKKSWEEACKLMEVTEDVAPWYLREGGSTGDELEIELSKAADRFKKGLAELEAGLQESG